MPKLFKFLFCYAAFTLKNLISQDETPTAAAASQKCK